MSKAATNLQKYIQANNERLDKNVLRPSQYGAFQHFQNDTNRPDSIVTPEDVATVNQSWGTGVEIPVLNDPNISIVSAETCAFQTTDSTSALKALTFVKYAGGFRMSKHEEQSNYIRYQRDFGAKMKSFELKLLAAIDSACVSTLNTDRNQVWTDVADVFSGDPSLNDALQVSSGAEAEDSLNRISQIMSQLDFLSDRYGIIANTGLKALMRKLYHQGEANDDNTNFQFDEFDFLFSNRVTNGTGKMAYAVPYGQVAMLNRNSPECRAGERTGDGTEWDELTLPMSGLTVGSIYKSRCEDLSAANGGGVQSAASAAESFQFFTEVAYVTPYNPDLATNASPIIKAEFL